MELKVWVEGIQRIICGVTEYTTCQDIVYALAHATGQTGRFTLIERWRNNERLLAPQEHPLKILNKWGEYSNDVQFVLERTSIPAASIVSPNSSALSEQSPTGKMSPSKINANAVMIPSRDGGLLADATRCLTQYSSVVSPDPARNIKKSLTISTGGGYQNHRVGIVRGVPQQQQQRVSLYPSPAKCTSPILQPPSQTQPPPPYREPPRPKSPSSQQQQPPPYRAPPSPGALPGLAGGLGSDPSADNKAMSLEHLADGYKSSTPSPNSPAASSPHGHSSSPSAEEQNQSNLSSAFKNSRKSLFKAECDDSPTQQTTNIALSSQYKELLRLVNQQREKLGSLQADLTKYDAEITFWEGKTREQQHKAEFLAQEGVRLQETNRIIEDQMLALKNIEEEKEISKQQSKTLKSEMTLLRSKLANCETELLQCKIKIRHLLEELQMEQRAVAREEAQAQQDGPGNEVMEQIEQLQQQLEEAKAAAARDCAAGSQLDKEVELLESLIQDKKQQVEQLVQDMKEANLHSLSISPATDEGLRSHLLEGIHKAGSSRRMIGSPRQLENAVPTSKNPHGVWV